MTTQAQPGDSCADAMTDVTFPLTGGGKPETSSGRGHHAAWLLHAGSRARIHPRLGRRRPRPSINKYEIRTFAPTMLLTDEAIRFAGLPFEPEMPIQSWTAGSCPSNAQMPRKSNSVRPIAVCS